MEVQQRNKQKKKDKDGSDMKYVRNVAGIIKKKNRHLWEC